MKLFIIRTVSLRKLRHLIENIIAFI
jgi:hypothetical protein